MQGESNNPTAVPSLGAGGVSLHVLPGMPLVRPGDDLALIVVARLEAARLGLQPRDVLVIAQKIVSKAEGRVVDLGKVVPSAAANKLAHATGKDPSFVEMILRESQSVVKFGRELIIAEHRAGWIMANAGIDQSNVAAPGDGEHVLLLPEDCDASAAAVRNRLESHYGCEIGVVINDSFGHPWRRGTVGVALGASGLPSVIDMRSRPDLFGRRLRATEIGFADEIASAASLLMGQAAAGRPVILIRGLSWAAPASPARSICRNPSDDLFR